MSQKGQRQMRNKVSIQFRNNFIVKHLLQNYNNQSSFVKIKGNNIFVVRKQDKIIKQSIFRSHSMHSEIQYSQKNKGYQFNTYLQPMKIESLTNQTKESQSQKKLQSSNYQDLIATKHSLNSVSQQFTSSAQCLKKENITSLQKYYYKRNSQRTIIKDCSSVLQDPLKSSNPLIYQNSQQMKRQYSLGLCEELKTKKIYCKELNSHIILPKSRKLKFYKIVEKNFDLKSKIKECTNEIDRFEKGLQHSEEDDDFDEYVNAIKAL